MNQEGCAFFSQFPSFGAPTSNCSAIGLASMFLALIAAAIATTIVLSTLRNARAVALAVAGLVTGPLVLCMVSIVTFAVRGA